MKMQVESGGTRRQGVEEEGVVAEGEEADE